MRTGFLLEKKNAVYTWPRQLLTVKILHVAHLHVNFIFSVSLGAGRGVFAGHNFSKRVLLSSGPSILMSYAATLETQVNNYVFSSHSSEYTYVPFGPECMYNHNNPKLRNSAHSTGNPDLASDIDPSIPPEYPFTTYPRSSHSSSREIKEGEEIFTSYGDPTWFSYRGIEYEINETNSPCVNATCSRSAQELMESGHCLTDVEVKPSLIGGAGQGLFATRSFAAGEVVSISPALILPKHIIGSPEAHSVLLNYAFSVSGSDVALLPLGLGAMSNHGGSDSNMHVEWFDWSSGASGVTPSAVSDNSVYELESRKFAPVDIAYVARRSISEGEELTIDYGPEWTRAWKLHLSSLALNDSSVGSIPILADGELDSFNQTENPIKFVHAVGAPEGLFPLSWNVDCIGDKFCDYSSIRHTDADTSGCGLYLDDSTIPGNASC